MIDKQPEALRLADALAKDPAVTWGDVEKAAEELRRLYEENIGLREGFSWDLSHSATVERARKVVRLITERNQNVWSEIDRETVHAINALINFAVIQFHNARTKPPKREWVGLTDEEAWGMLGQMSLGASVEDVRFIEAKLKEKNT